MKKINLIITFLLFSLVWGQSKLDMHYSLDYSFYSNDESMNEKPFVKHYIPQKFSESGKASLLFFETYDLSGAPGYLYFQEGKAIEIYSNNLNNNFKIKDRFSAYDFYSDPIDTLYHKVEFVKADIPSKKILERTCNNYYIKTINEGVESVDFMLCVEESSEIDNLSFLFPKQEGTKVKGLILQFAPFDLYETEGLHLKAIEKINSSIQFDFQKEYADYVAKRDSLRTAFETEIEKYDEDSFVDPVAVDDYTYESEYANQPGVCNYEGFFDLNFSTDKALDIASNYLNSLCSMSYYLKAGEEETFKAFAIRDAKTATKNFRKEGLFTKADEKMFYNFIKAGFEKLQKSEYSIVEAAAKATEDAAWAAEDYDWATDLDAYLTPYVSEYAEMKPEGTDYAIDQLEEDSPLWKTMPSYCQKVDSIVPNFSNAELKLHAKNYAGQICDMYLGEFSPENVWYKGTLDAIRAEQKYFSTIKEKLNNNDTKLLDEFLNSLD